MQGKNKAISYNYMILRLFLQILLLAFALVPSGLANDDRANPETNTPLLEHEQRAIAHEFMISTAHPLATQAGYEMLERGGSAADAMIAAQLVLGLVEPQSSGLGGGAFALYYDADQKRLSSIDARETAPGLAGPFLFYKDGQALGFKEAQLGGRSVGVPGVPKLLEQMHQAYGKLTWMELFEPAIDLAEHGFQVTPRLEGMIEAYAENLKNFDGAKGYLFTLDGQSLKRGDVLKNKDYAETLRDMAFSGSSAIYEGPLAEEIESVVQNYAENPGILTRQDLQSYRLEKRNPVCAPYRIYKICSMGEPSSGGLTILQTLSLLEPYKLAELGAKNPESWNLIAQASALAFTDRNLYMADPDFVNTPGILLLDPRYIEERRKLIDPLRPLKEAKIAAGVPPLWNGPLYAEGNTIDKPGTSHISVVDGQGNVLSMTTTIESAFGSHLMAGGFFLNNELTDFSFEPFGEDGRLVANMIEGGKRPRSSMAPVIVFDHENQPILVIGSAGGSRIIGYVLQRIIAVLDWGIGVQEALAMPNILARSSNKIEVEENDELAREITSAGHTVEITEMNSGLTAIEIKGDTLIGAADPRREGIAKGR